MSFWLIWEDLEVNNHVSRHSVMINDLSILKKKVCRERKKFYLENLYRPWFFLKFKERVIKKDFSLENQDSDARMVKLTNEKGLTIEFLLLKINILKGMIKESRSSI